MQPLIRPSMFSHRPAAITLIVMSLVLSACNFPVSSGTQTPASGLTSTPAIISGTPANTTATPAPSATIPVELSSLKDTTVRIVHPWTGDAGVEFGKLVNEFNRENVWKIKVEEVQGGSVSETARIVKDNLESSDQLDMAVIPPEYLAEWNAAGNIIDLTSFITNPEWGIPEKEKSAYLSQVLKITPNESQQFSIPAQVNLQFLVYNQTWAKELGFSAAPETQADFTHQVCKAAEANNLDKTKENDGTGGWIINTASPILLSWINAFGGSKAWDNGTKVSLNQTETGDAFTYLRSLTEKGCAWSSRVASPFTYFAGRQALVISATLPDLLELENTLSSGKNSDEWVILPYPGEEKGAPALMSGLTYGISKSRPANELASWLFLRWMMLPRNQVRLAEAAGSIPPTSTAIELMKDYGNQHSWWTEAVKMLPNSLMLPVSTDWRQIRPVLEDSFWQMLQPTPMPIPTLLEQLDETIRSAP